MVASVFIVSSSRIIFRYNSTGLLARQSASQPGRSIRGDKNLCFQELLSTCSSAGECGTRPISCFDLKLNVWETGGYVNIGVFSATPFLNISHNHPPTIAQRRIVIVPATEEGWGRDGPTAIHGELSSPESIKVCVCVDDGPLNSRRRRRLNQICIPPFIPDPKVFLGICNQHRNSIYYCLSEINSKNFPLKNIQIKQFAPPRGRNFKAKRWGVIWRWIAGKVDGDEKWYYVCIPAMLLVLLLLLQSFL